MPTNYENKTISNHSVIFNSFNLKYLSQSYIK